MFKITPEAIRDVRKKVANMTQKEFAEALGITPLAVARVEGCTLLPSLRLLFKISKRFDVTFEIDSEWLHPLLADKTSD